MNETLSLVPALVAGVVLGAMFLRRPVVDGSQGRFVPTAGAVVFRQPAAADEHCRWLDSIWFRVVIGSGCWCASLDLSLRVCS